MLNGWWCNHANQKNGMANVLDNFYFITDIQVEQGTVGKNSLFRDLQILYGSYRIVERYYH